MDPVQKKYKKALKVSEIVDYLQDIEDSIDEELNDIEIAILPDEIDNTDKAFKICPLIEKANESFRKFGIFESNLAIDEMIVKYFGHHGIKHFIKGKPVRFGYKLWALCGVSGY
ncbi:unnamed protein product [Parnassius apollo]|uniref:(apollo) hypothetical protein n=1 Tax=Parnassius apollo TaxID=110799 RepID=A0A8S3WPI0_PARAO|nr:unnamed protein product [Parnassius apollo]